ncbi:SCO family protein [Neiella marina]|uniref:SCO family protein n=1 Tax=Neiella holothuriorum TaxID=2870530 RepID=A0ABS7EAS8_9GAMM|nr:SCO family protein [Neiella holothuriorum]MBW8189422.1 SCO family protein [Neiella holothuriorum]
MGVRIASIAAVFLAVIVLAAALPWLPSLLQSEPYYGLRVDKTAYDFPFENTNNSEQRLSDLKGRYVYLLFGYLRCADICHRQVANMLALNNQLSEQAVSFVFVSLDPERDASNQLQAYFDSQGQHFHSVRPNNEAAAHALANEYNEYFIKTGEGAGYDIDHSGFMYVVNPDGKLSLIYTNSKLNVEAMLNDLKQLQRS